MRRFILFASLWALFIVGFYTKPALEQTFNLCPTLPAADSSNACASTAFVHSAFTALGALTGLTGDVSATGPGNATATIQPGAVTSGKLAAGAAATNVGTLGGSLTGTLPNPGVASGAIANANLANSTAGDSYKGRIGAAGAIADNPWSNCNGSNHALQYTNGTGTQCATDVADLDVADQTISGGGNVTSLSLATGNVTIDCGARPLQFITNGGAFTITAPANDGSCMLLVTNNATAGAITFSGFSVPSSPGDTLDTTNTHKFTISIWRINGTSGYRVAAHQ